MIPLPAGCRVWIATASNRWICDSLQIMDAAALLNENAALKAELAVAREKASEDMALIAAKAPDRQIAAPDLRAEVGALGKAA